MIGRDSHSGTTAAATPKPDRPFVPGIAGRLLARAYACAVSRRNAGFDAGRRVITFDRPVISVGNLSLGGTGKTPMVARIAALLREHGHAPCIAMRGYGAGRSGGRSDEADLYRALLGDLPIVAQPNRVEGLIRLFGSPEGESVDCILLDDGFQHRRIARQLDLVLVDATHDLFASGVFPAGRLREPVGNLARATHLVLTHSDLVHGAALEALMRRLADIAPGRLVATASHRWANLLVREGERDREEPVSWLRGKRVVTACGIGRPGSFLAAVERAGANAADSFVLGDHHPFDGATLARIAAAAESGGAEAVVVTEKDWTKLDGRVRWPCPVVRPRLEIAFRRGWEELERDLLGVASSRPE